MKPIPFSPNWQRSDESPRPAADPGCARTDSSLDIIVAEDDPVSRELLCGLLANWGYRVTCAHDGREAMEALRAQTRPVLAILDWMMPGLDGIEICRRIRDIKKPAYIILVTARAAKEQIVEGLQAGADDYLTKPFDKEELRARLQAGVRIMELQAALNTRVAELEAALEENRELKLRIPL